MKRRASSVVVMVLTTAVIAVLDLPHFATSSMSVVSTAKAPDTASVERHAKNGEFDSLPDRKNNGERAVRKGILPLTPPEKEGLSTLQGDRLQKNVKHDDSFDSGRENYLGSLSREQVPPVRLSSLYGAPHGAGGQSGGLIPPLGDGTSATVPYGKWGGKTVTPGSGDGTGPSALPSAPGGSGAGASQPAGSANQSLAPPPTASAVPVPSSVWLLGFGLMGLIGVRRRLKSKP